MRKERESVVYLVFRNSFPFRVEAILFERVCVCERVVEWGSVLSVFHNAVQLTVTFTTRRESDSSPCEILDPKRIHIQSRDITYPGIGGLALNYAQNRLYDHTHTHMQKGDQCQPVPCHATTIIDCSIQHPIKSTQASSSAGN